MPTKPERTCDIVMKGGITSGVVYPKAIAKLSKHFTFKNVGGTSAGAIAAAATAAAEYRRVRTGSEKGFEILEGRGDELSKVSGKTNRTMLSSLFVPNPSTRREVKFCRFRSHYQYSIGQLKGIYKYVIMIAVTVKQPGFRAFQPGP